MENPGKQELKRIIKCMKDYEYDDTSLEQGVFDGDYKFKLIKRVDYSSDETIKVTIEFSTVFDDENTYEKNDNDIFLYNINNNDKANNFINKLRQDALTKKGGQKREETKINK